MGRRCFSDKIVESDAFCSLPDNAQTLYLHLNMNADDDGFINNAQSVASKAKSGKAALQKLVEKRFLLRFGDVYVVKHWRISNSLKNDRLKPLTYATVAAQVWVKPNRAYTDHPAAGSKTLYELRTGKPPESIWNPSGICLESNWNPNLTQPNITEPNITEPKELESVCEKILASYPEARVGNAASVMEAYKQTITNVADAAEAVANLELWKRSEQWNKDGGKYIPYLANWILRGTWRTKPDKMAVPQGASGELGEAELEAIRRVLSQPLPDIPEE